MLKCKSLVWQKSIKPMKMKFSVVGALAACMMSAAQRASISYLSGSGVTDLSDGTAWDGGV